MEHGRSKVGPVPKDKYSEPRMDTRWSLKLDNPKVEPKEPMIKQKIESSTELTMFTLKAEL
eukprot:14190638-Ditylum_brightwellii.AAC.1